MSATAGTIKDRLRASIQHAVLHHRSPDLEHDALEEIKRLEREVAVLERKINHLISERDNERKQLAPRPA